MNLKVNVKNLLINVGIPLFLGSIVGYLTAPCNDYLNLNLPSFAPPALVFPIVWTILYILMGISSYLIYESGSSESKEALRIYGIQLGVNLLWSFVFFCLKWYLIAFIWIVVLIILVIIMIRKFYNINKTAAYLQIPYLIWLVFASILSLSVVFLN